MYWQKFCLVNRQCKLQLNKYSILLLIYFFLIIFNNIFFSLAYFIVRIQYMIGITYKMCSIQFSHSGVSDSSRPHELQHARPPCPSPTPGVYPNSCPLSWSCQLTISSSVIHFFSCLQSFPTSGSFQMSQLFTSGGQNIGISASTSVLPVNTQDWSPLAWTG